MDSFAVTQAPGRLVMVMAVLVVLGLLAWRMIPGRLSGAQATLARVILLIGIPGWCVLYYEMERTAVRVNGTQLVVTWPFAGTTTYGVSDVDFFDIQSHTSFTGKAGTSTRYQAILLVFSDSSYIDVPLYYRNGERFHDYLIRHGVPQGLPLGHAPFRRSY